MKLLRNYGFDFVCAICDFQFRFLYFPRFSVIVLLVPAQARVAPIFTPQTQTPHKPASSSTNGHQHPPLNWLRGKAFTSYLSVEDEKITQHLESALFYKTEKIKKTVGFELSPPGCRKPAGICGVLGLIGYWA